MAGQDAVCRHVERPVFVVGPTRSGTTVVRHALNRHPDLAVTPETHLLDVWFPRFPGVFEGRDLDAFWGAYVAGPDFARSELDERDVWARVLARDRPDARTVMAALMTAWADCHGATRVGEKTPAHARYLATLFAWFPDARVVWMRRDPRDTVASQMAFEQEWAADDAATPARHWARIERAWRRWRDDPRVLTVRYEDLVAAPRQILASVLTHADLPDHEDVLAGPPPRPGRWHGGHDPAARVSATRVGRWNQQLSARDAGTVDALTARGRRGGPYASVMDQFAAADRWAYRWGGVRGWTVVSRRDGGDFIVRAVRAVRDVRS